MSESRIKTLVGRKFGGWFVGPRVFRSEMEAEAEIVNLERAERLANCTVMTRRVVPA